MKPKGLGRGLSALIPDADRPDTDNASLKTIPVGEIRPNPMQPRREFREAELKDLVDSIRAKGVIQPLVVRRAVDGYELIAGERRLRAARLAGYAEVPCRLLDVGTDVEMLELSLVENLQRDDLNAVELAEGYRKLAEGFDLTQEQIAERVGKERATVANTLRLLDLPDPVRDSLRQGEITVGHAKAILGLAGQARRSAVWKRVVGEQLSVRQTEELVKGLGDGARVGRKRSAPKDAPEMRQYLDRLRRSLGTQVVIQKRGRKGTIKIEFYTEED